MKTIWIILAFVSGLDHFNILVIRQHGIKIWRILDVVMIVGGVIIIRNF